MSREDVQAPRDAEWLAAAIGSWPASRRLAVRGRTPSPAMLAEALGGSVVMQQAAWAPDRTPAALFQVSDLDQRDGTARLDLLVDPAHTACVRQELPGFLGEVFEAEPLQPLRKLCLWTADDQLDVPAYLGSAAQLVGRLVAHDRRGPATHADMLIYEIWKEHGR